MALIIALDGHDGSGKTTLARAFAAKIGGAYRRPFHGTLGASLLKAGEVNDFSRVISLGNNALELAANTQNTEISIVLDRAWMTVASLLDPDHVPMFCQDWERRIPTILCWSDLEVTLKRLAARAEPFESIDWHRRYLSIYRNLAETCHCPILRTDVHSETECLQQMSRWIEQLHEANISVPKTIPEPS